MAGIVCQEELKYWQHDGTALSAKSNHNDTAQRNSLHRVALVGARTPFKPRVEKGARENAQTILSELLMGKGRCESM